MSNDTSQEIQSQAAKITRICGVERLAKWTGRSVTQVYRWDYSREKGGAGGVIPAVHHQAILDGARAEKIDLVETDFFAEHLPAEPSSNQRAS